MTVDFIECTFVLEEEYIYDIVVCYYFISTFYFVIYKFSEVPINTLLCPIFSSHR